MFARPIAEPAALKINATRDENESLLKTAPFFEDNASIARMIFFLQRSL